MIHSGQDLAARTCNVTGDLSACQHRILTKRTYAIAVLYQSLGYCRSFFETLGNKRM